MNANRQNRLAGHAVANNPDQPLTLSKRIVPGASWTAILALFLAGCTTLATQNPQVAQFTRQDVQTALGMAQAAGDQQGANCFTAVLAALPPEGAPSPAQPTGLISTYEGVRIVRLNLQTGIPDSVASACAPMVLNSQAALLNAFNFLRP